MPGRSPSPLRAVFFDAGNTLIHMDYAAIAAALSRHGVRVGPGAVQRAEWRARVRLDAEVLARPAAAASTESAGIGARYLAFVLEALGVTDDAVVRAMAAWRRDYNVPFGLWTVAEPAAGAALALVREAGLGAAVISNSNGTVRAILETLGLARWLDFVIDSSEVGIEKPDPRIFELALARAGLGPRETVYIGDLYSIDVVGARGAGITPVLLDPGALWGSRDCPTAPDLPGAIRLALGTP